MDKDLYDLPPEEEKAIPKVCFYFDEALAALDADREFLTKGGVFTDDLIDAYITLKSEEVTRLRMTTHPVEFDMYYSLALHQCADTLLNISDHDLLSWFASCYSSGDDRKTRQMCIKTTTAGLWKDLSIAVLVLDQQLRLLFMNSAAETLFELSFRKAHQLALPELIVGAESFMAGLRHCLENGHPTSSGSCN
jgi:PAS domain-containing protein